MALRIFTIVIAAVSAELFVTQQTQAAIISIEAGGGAFIREDNAGGNFGANAQIIVGANTTGGGDFGPLRGLLEFDLTAIETAAGGNPFTIDSVTLGVHTASQAGAVTGAASAPITYNLSLLDTNTDFDENTVTWTNAPSAAGGTIGTSLSSTAFNPATETSTDQTFGDTASFRTAVSDALSTDPLNFLRLILNVATDEFGVVAQNFTRLDSDDVATTANRPTLTVNYTVNSGGPEAVVPEPSTLVLATLGLLGMGWLGWRRRKRA